jgi:hypothetical protein
MKFPLVSFQIYTLLVVVNIIIILEKCRVSETAGISFIVLKTK